MGAAEVHRAVADLHGAAAEDAGVGVEGMRAAVESEDAGSGSLEVTAAGASALEVEGPGLRLDEAGVVEDDVDEGEAGVHGLLDGALVVEHGLGVALVERYPPAIGDLDVEDGSGQVIDGSALPGVDVAACGPGGISGEVDGPAREPLAAAGDIGVAVDVGRTGARHRAAGPREEAGDGDAAGAGQRPSAEGQRGCRGVGVEVSCAAGDGRRIATGDVVGAAEIGCTGGNLDGAIAEDAGAAVEVVRPTAKPEGSSRCGLEGAAAVAAACQVQGPRLCLHGAAVVEDDVDGRCVGTCRASEQTAVVEDGDGAALAVVERVAVDLGVEGPGVVEDGAQAGPDVAAGPGCGPRVVDGAAPERLGAASYVHLGGRTDVDRAQSVEGSAGPRERVADRYVAGPAQCATRESQVLERRGVGQSQVTAGHDEILVAVYARHGVRAGSVRHRDVAHDTAYEDLVGRARDYTGVPMSRVVPEAAAAHPEDRRFDQGELADDVVDAQGVSGSVGHLGRDYDHAVTARRLRCVGYENRAVSVAQRDGQWRYDRPDRVLQLEVERVDRVGVDGLVEADLDRAEPLGPLLTVAGSDRLYDRSEGVGHQVEHQCVGQGRVAAGVGGAGAHLDRRSLAHRDGEGERDVRPDDLAVYDQVDAADLEVVGHGDLDRNGGALSDLNAWSSGIEIRDGAAQRNDRRHALVVEPQVVDDLEAGRSVCHESNPVGDEDADRLSGKLEAGQEDVGLRRVEDAHDGDVGPATAADAYKQAEA